MAKLIRRDFEDAAAEKGQVIRVNIPTSKTVSNVTPGTAQAEDLSPLKADITLNQYKQAGFALTAKEMAEIDSKGILVGEASQAIAALSDNVEAAIIALGKQTYGYSGAVDATPDGVDDMTTSRKELNTQKAPKANRAMVVSSTVEDKLLQLAALTNAQNVGEANQAVVAGELGTRYGFRIASTQNMDDLTYDDGTQDGAYLVDQADVAIGDETVNIDTGTGTILTGAIFTVAGDTQKYVSTDDCAGGADATLNFSPPAKVAWANNAAITVIASHKLGGLAFNEDWAVLATRKVVFTENWGNMRYETYTDPQTGVTFGVKVEYAHYKEWFNWFILYGTGILRHECGIRMLSNA
jgi:hypothetical protein